MTRRSAKPLILFCKIMLALKPSAAFGRSTSTRTDTQRRSRTERDCFWGRQLRSLRFQCCWARPQSSSWNKSYFFEQDRKNERQSTISVAFPRVLSSITFRSVWFCPSISTSPLRQHPSGRSRSHSPLRVLRGFDNYLSTL